MPKTFSWAECATATKEIMLQMSLQMDGAAAVYLAACREREMGLPSSGGVSELQAAAALLSGATFNGLARTLLNALAADSSDWNVEPGVFELLRQSFPGKPAIHALPQKS
jgi:isopentenyl diphosphate isomerase/L-lactate dehydrogenase-like FMN-dependent dehydrogenase